MWDLETIIRDLFSSKNLQEFINNRFSSEDHIVVNTKFVNFIERTDGLRFRPFQFNSVNEPPTEYLTDDLRKNDIVLDIGGCIGSFSLRVFRDVSRVYVVEPIMVEYLKENISLNNAHNITLIEGALGNGIINVEWNGKQKQVQGLTLSEIIDLCGAHVDFLKLDCEGGEYCIKPEELKTIRRIEAEIHRINGKNFEDFLKILDIAGFRYDCERLSNKKLMLVHAWRK